MKISRILVPVVALTMINNPNNQVRAMGIREFQAPVDYANPADCVEKLFAQTAACLSFSFPPAVIACEALAWTAYYICMRN